jgi:ribonuclease HI
MPDPRPPKIVTIYCDGSSLGNGREDPRAAAAALLNWRDQWRAFGCYLGAATNQQAEIVAAALGLERLDRAVAGHSIEWQWIKGHAGHGAQEAVDKAARTIAAMGRADEGVLREAAETANAAGSG